MDKIKNLILDFLGSNKFGAFCWTTANGFASILIAYIGGLPYELVPLMVGILNMITKYLNKTYNPNHKI